MTDKAYYEEGFDIVSARERFLGKREMCERYVIRFLEDPNYEEMIKAIREKTQSRHFIMHIRSKESVRTCHSGGCRMQFPG